MKGDMNHTERRIFLVNSTSLGIKEYTSVQCSSIKGDERRGRLEPVQ